MGMFKAQAELDKRIGGRRSVDHLRFKKELALLVELGELANELPEVFKYWSCKENNYERALEEYVDCLHFILSIGIDLGADDTDIEKIFIDHAPLGLDHKFNKQGVLYRLRHVAKAVWTLDEYENNFTNFVELGYAIDFSYEQIKRAYFDKVAINHKRQEDGY